MAIVSVATPEFQMFVHALRHQLGRLYRAHAERRKQRGGAPLMATPDVRKWMGLVNEMRRNWDSGDVSYTVEQFRATGDLAEWAVKQWHDLHGTPAPSRETYFPKVS